MTAAPGAPAAPTDGCWAIIAGGGTAGHVVPGLAIGAALVESGHPAGSLHFVGSQRGIEARMVPQAGFSLTVLPGRGIQRRLTLANVGAVWGLLRAMGQSIGLVRRLHPAVLVSLGGYASVPCALAAVLSRIPIVVAEQNAVPGLANRLVGRRARACAVSFPGTPLPRAVLTGNPVRATVLGVDRARDRDEARQQLGLPLDRQVVAVFGGSLGARRINEAVAAALPSWSERHDLAVYHVVGERDWPVVQASRMSSASTGAFAPPAAGTGSLTYQAVPFEDRFHLLLAAADVAVCRAGASTVAELTVVGLPAVLVPLPGAPGDHQTANARALEEAGGAVVVPDAELDGPRLLAEVERLVTDPHRLVEMGKASSGLGRRDAAQRVARLVEEHARRG